MTRLSRIVITLVPHHVTQRGNRRLSVLFSDEARRAYLGLVAEAAQAHGTRCLAWFLIDNHARLILVPMDAGGLCAKRVGAPPLYSHDQISRRLVRSSVSGTVCQLPNGRAL
jgi:putative transposase